jgi:hypothetical protein
LQVETNHSHFPFISASFKRTAAGSLLTRFSVDGALAVLAHAYESFYAISDLGLYPAHNSEWIYETVIQIPNLCFSNTHAQSTQIDIIDRNFKLLD